MLKRFSGNFLWLCLLPVAEWNHGLVLVEVFANGNGHEASVKGFDHMHTDWTCKRVGKYLDDKAV